MELQPISDYKEWLGELKKRVRSSQLKAAVKVNTELLYLYWDLGQDIVLREMESSWGSGFFDKLSKDLRAEFPGIQGFSPTNLKYCKRFYLFYSRGKINRQQLADELQTNDLSSGLIRHQLGDEFEDHPIFQIPWFHHVQIFTKCKTIDEAFFYVKKTIENGWSRAVLMNFIEADMFSAQGKSQTNYTSPEDDVFKALGVE